MRNIYCASYRGNSTRFTILKIKRDLNRDRKVKVSLFDFKANQDLQTYQFGSHVFNETTR